MFYFNRELWIRGKSNLETHDFFFLCLLIARLLSLFLKMTNYGRMVPGIPPWKCGSPRESRSKQSGSLLVLRCPCRWIPLPDLVTPGLAVFIWSFVHHPPVMLTGKNQQEEPVSNVSQGKGLNKKCSLMFSLGIKLGLVYLCMLKFKIFF